MTTAPGRRPRTSRDDAPDPVVGRGDLAVVRVHVGRGPAREDVVRVRRRTARAARRSAPRERAADPRGARVDVRGDLLLAQRRIGELDLGVLEAEVLVLEAREAVLVDEEHGRRIERARTPPVAPQVLRPRLGVLAEAERQERPHVLAGHHRRRASTTCAASGSTRASKRVPSAASASRFGVVARA